MNWEEKNIEQQEIISILRKQISVQKKEMKELNGRIFLLESFLGEKLKTIPDYESLCNDPDNSILSTIHKWLTDKDFDMINGLLVYISKIEMSKTKIITESIGSLLRIIDDELHYFDLLEILIKFNPSIFARTIHNNNYISRHKLSKVGIDRINNLIPLFFSGKDKYHYILPFIAEYNEYITPENRTYILSQSHKAVKPTAIESLYHIICGLTPTQMIEVFLQKEGIVFCFQIFWLLMSNKSFTSKYIHAIASDLEKKGIAGKIASQILRKQKIDNKICNNNSLQKIKAGDYEEFARVINAYEQKIDNSNKLKQSELLQGNILEMKLGSQMIHHYTFVNQDVPLVGILPRQCVWDLPSKNAIKRCRVLKVLKEHKLMIVTEEFDNTKEALYVPLLNIGDEIELKFSNWNKNIVWEVIGCKFAKVDIQNMPRQVDYRKKYIAIVLSQTSFVEFVVKIC